jgi:hypothetical protein
MNEAPPATATESAEFAYHELASLWEHLPLGWTTGRLKSLHEASRNEVIELFVRERGLAELVHRFFENGLTLCTSADDLGEMPIPTNLSSLLTLLRAEYAGALVDVGVARAELAQALSASVGLLLQAAEPQVAALALLITRVLTTLHRLRLAGGRIILPELPVGNSIACKILQRALTQAGYTVADLRISLPRNETRKNGVRRIDVLAAKLRAFGLQENDFVLYVDEWESGSNFAAICDAFERCLASHANTFLLPVALLREDSKDQPRYARFVEKHDLRVKPFSVARAELRIVVPPIPSRFRRRSYFFWSEHDRTSGYRKMQFLGSLYSSFDAAIEALHSDPGILLDALRHFLDEAQSSKSELPPDMTGAESAWVEFFATAYEDWVVCRAELENIEHFSNLADVEDVETSFREVISKIQQVVRGRPAEGCLKVAVSYARRKMRVSVDPEDRYHFKNHAAVVTDLEGDFRLFHEMLMNRMFLRLDALALA